MTCGLAILPRRFKNESFRVLFLYKLMEGRVTMGKPSIVQLEDYEPFVGGEAAERIVLVLRDEQLRERLGNKRGKREEAFLPTRYLEQYLIYSTLRRFIGNAS
jgi:hypothetical protein